MTEKINTFRRIQGISLKLKLLIPFLFFTLAIISTLTVIGTTSQQNLIKNEEKNVMLHHYRHFITTLGEKERQSLAIASSIAEIPEVGRLLLLKERDALYSHLEPVYRKLMENYNISQFHFHVPPGISFLRLHKPEKFGDKVDDYRKTVSTTLEKGTSSACLEKGATGFGIRGVAPVYYNNKIVGSIGIGYSFGRAFVDDFHRAWGVNTSLYDIKNNGEYELIDSAGDVSIQDIAALYRQGRENSEPVILFSPEEYPDRSVIIGPVTDCSGKNVALIAMNKDRSAIIRKLNGTENLMISIGFAVTIVSFLFTYLVIDLFIKPIREIVDEAQDIALGKRESRIESKPPDEIGTLSNALNTMLEALKLRRIEVENYARTLEKRVKERTSALVASEEKYRTVVENVPLVVYRILADGTTEFVNSYLTEHLGYTIEEAVGNRRFWKENIGNEAPEKFRTMRETCFTRGEDCRLDHPVRAKDGRLLHFITHAIPSMDENGEVKWVDGFMLDITELKKLQERALQTEEVRTLGEISARMAHEIRNPLSIAGGFARRLRDALEDDDPKKRLALIIVEEVAKLEVFVTGLLSTITPFNLVLKELDINSLVEECTSDLDRLLEKRKINIQTDTGPGIPPILADYNILSQAMINILKHAVVSTPPGETITIATGKKDDSITLKITHRLEHLSDDDIEQFFFPHIEQNLEESVLDLPLAKIIIHRHGGRIELIRGDSNLLTVVIEFPAAVS